MSRCQSCCEEPGELLFSARDVEDELAVRERLLQRGRDLTDVALGTPAEIRRCARCGIVIRGDVTDDEVFREDRYRTSFLRSLHEAHARHTTDEMSRRTGTSR